MEKLKLDNEGILDLYSQDYSMTYIAKLVGCDLSVIKRILMESYVEIKPQKYYMMGRVAYNRKDLPENEIIDMYNNQNISGNKIAKKFNCSNIVIYELLKRNNIETSKGHFVREKLKIKNDEIIEMYNNGLSITKIAEIIGNSQTQIYKLLKKNNVEIKGAKIFNIGNPPYNTGKERSQNTKKKISAKLQGISLGEWEKFSSFEPYDEKFNQKFRRLVRKRDNHICIKCGVHQEKLSRTLDVHHINYNKKLTMLQNCCSLCRKCHTATNFNRKHWTAFFQSLLNERYDYQYSDNEILLNFNKENSI